MHHGHVCDGIQVFTNLGATLVQLERLEEALQAYAHVIQAFKHNNQASAGARSMYAQITKRIAAQAFNDGRCAYDM